MSKPIKSFYDATKYLGQYVGLNPKLSFLVSSACMSPERRAQLAVLTVVKEALDPDKNKNLITFFDSFLFKLIEKLGYAEWVRDTVTDLAIAKGMKSGEEETYSIELEAEPENESIESA